MATALLQLADIVVQRLRSSPSYGVQSASIRHSHRTPRTKDECPAINVVASEIEPPKSAKHDCVERVLRMQVSLGVRNDDALDALDPILEAMTARLDPREVVAPAYPSGVTVKMGRVLSDDELADSDVLVVHVEYLFTYTSTAFSLVIS